MTWWALLLGCGASTGPAPPPPAPLAVEVPASPLAPAPAIEPKAASVEVELWFYDRARLRGGGEPLVSRSVEVPAGTLKELAQAVVDAVFRGPDDPSLRTLAQGATGGRVQLDGDVATVMIEGPCRGGGAANVHDQLVRSLRGLDGVAHVRTVDPGGRTPPVDVVDHRAECLEP